MHFEVFLVFSIVSFAQNDALDEIYRMHASTAEKTSNNLEKIKQIELL